jgi:hypothetical protein
MAAMRAWSWALLAAAVVGLFPAVSLARVPTRLVYVRAQSAADCPDEPGLVAAVAARLGYDPFSPWGDQTIVANIVRRGGELVGRAELIDHDGIAQGTRQVSVAPADCGELVLALSLAISITLDPLYVEPPASTPATPVDAAPPQPAPPAPLDHAAPVAGRAANRQPDRPRTAHPKPNPLITWHVGAAAIGAVEAAPHMTFGGRLGVAAQRARWSIGLEAWSTLPATRTAAAGGEVRVSLLAAALAPCFHISHGLSLCGFGSLGSLRAEGRGVDDAHSDQALHAAAGGRGLFAVPLGSTFELVANIDVAAALNRPRFQLDGSDVWRPGPVLALAGLGVGARFF